MRVAIAVGGTAGHVIPSLAVAERLKSDGVLVEFIGGDRAERELVPQAGYTLHTLNVRGIDRRNPLKAIRAVFTAFGSVFRAVKLLRSIDPDVVMGGGGYMAGPVGLAAVMLRIPIVLTEADSHLGITNRLLAPFAKRVCLAFPINGRKSRKYVITGRPVLDVSCDVQSVRDQWQISDDDFVIVVFGGSLGARSINQSSLEALGGSPYRVIHVTGRRDFDSLTAPVSSKYSLLEYLDADQFGQVLAVADLAIARSGGSIFELTRAGLPAILVPYPHASADHQSENARWMVNAGAAVLIDDSKLSGQFLKATVDGLVQKPEVIAQMSAASKSLARPNAAQDIADQILQK